MNPDAQSLWRLPQWAFAVLLALLGMLLLTASAVVLLDSGSLRTRQEDAVRLRQWFARQNIPPR